MTIELELWHLITLAIMAGGSLVALAKYITEDMKKRMDAYENKHLKEATEWQRIEREMLKFQGSLPDKYVRREDYIRGQTVLEAKLDAVFKRIEQIGIQAARADK